MSTPHNPVNFDPSDYEVLDYLDNKRPPYCGGPAEAYREEVQQWTDEMIRTFGADYASKIHHCVHCGNGTIRWITAVRHVPTGDVVVFGCDCTKRLEFTDRMAFKLAQVQARASARQIRFTIYNKRTEFLAAHPDITEALAHVDDPVHARNTFAKDVLAKLDRFGELSEKQASAVVASMQRDRDYTARRAIEEAEVKGDAPTGRVTVTGTVLSTRVDETDFGTVVKMLLKLDNGARAWVTCPSGVERGDSITLAATWTVSPTDKSFAFGKRPHLIRTTTANQGVKP